MTGPSNLQKGVLPVSQAGRYRVRVKPSVPGQKPYAWEIYDEVENRIVRTSTERYRHQAEAWDAGRSVLDRQK